MLIEPSRYWAKHLSSVEESGDLILKEYYFWPSLYYRISDRVGWGGGPGSMGRRKTLGGLDVFIPYSIDSLAAINHGVFYSPPIRSNPYHPRLSTCVCYKN